VVLVVEADPDMRGAMAEALRADGYEVALAINCQEALRVMEHLDTPCLMLLDFSPFTLGGGDFLARLRADAARAAVPVIALAGEPGPAPLGVTVTLRKPVRLQALLSAVATHRKPR
jgi:CheY-like chemotaxis protein